jgi:glyoxylase-like metal-dependent hydrolase (beta-lactamase superfamily II)
VAGDVCFTGDEVLAQSSVFVAPDPGALRGYLAALERLRAMDLDLLCTGHGPPVAEPTALLDRYLAHRRDRERRLVAALADGLRTTDDLLDRVWDDAPPSLRLAAAATLAAHLGKLAEEGRLPDGVQQPPWPPPGGVRPVV